ncbi:MAG: Na/Pi cotransporter family protein [Lachnospirales bacterium]
MDNFLMLVNFLGGLGLFIFGITLMADGLQRSTGEKMKSLLKLLTSNRFIAVLVGAAVTAIIQSSSATTVMVVGFVNAGIINLSQSVGVIMGANIGTTITAWIASLGDWMTLFKPTTIAPIFVAVGVLIHVAGKKKKTKTLGSVLLGFGILFIGMDAMSDALKPLRENEMFRELFITLGTNPILGILAGAFVTAMVQSSSASMGILLALVSVGLIPTSAAVYIILGQNIGTCITALLSSMGASKNAKAAAYIHLLFNVIGSVIFAIGAVIFFSIPANQDLANSIISQSTVAIFHTTFNIVNTIMLFPFANLLIKIAKKMAKIDDNVIEVKPELHLDDRALVTPAFAVETVFDEINKLFVDTYENYKITIKALLDHDDSHFDEIKDNEDRINRKTDTLSKYLVKLMKLNLSNVESEKVAMYFNSITDIERIGDHVENLAEFLQIMVTKDIHFSKEAIVEITHIFDITESAITTSMNAFKNNDKEEAIRTIHIEEEVDLLESQLRSNHMKRLQKNVCETETGVIFLDMIQNLERISDHTNNISGYILKD